MSEETYGVELESDDEEYVEGYFQPFQCECRAFGRLKEFGMEHLGVRCYGYITLTDTHLAFMRSKYDFESWDYDPAYHEHKPVRAIVKELVYMGHDLSEKEYVALHVSPKTVPKMIKDLKAMHRLGISINDVDFDNYIHGKFLDLSHAWTAPHPLLLKHKDPTNFPPLLEAKNDAMKMDEFIDIWNEWYPNRWIWNRLLPNPEYTQKLRPRKRRNNVWNIRPEHFTYESVSRRFKIGSHKPSPGKRLSLEKSIAECSGDSTKTTPNHNKANNGSGSTKEQTETRVEGETPPRGGGGGG